MEQLYQECMTALLSAFPRAVFSEPELEITRWFASRFGIKKLPSIRAVKQRKNEILKQAGNAPTLVKGTLGNHFSVAKLARIIEHVSCCSCG